jgi:endonuclease/exonuclease/phosphatase family metal-dependent hydrolase
MVKVLSYNIRHGAGLDGRIDLERIAEVIRRANPDLVALQEVDQCCERSGNQDTPALLGQILGMEHRFGRSLDFQGGEYGLAVLSRLPVTDTIPHTLPSAKEPRCALEVQVQAEAFESTLSFICIHNDYVSEEIRARQIRTLLASLRDRAHPTILAGDFNCEGADGSMKLLEEEGWTVLDKKAEKTFPADEPEKEIDFIVLRGFPEISVEHGVIDEKVASDHRPIYAVITHRDPVGQ